MRGLIFYNRSREEINNYIAKQMLDWKSFASLLKDAFTYKTENLLTALLEHYKINNWDIAWLYDECPLHEIKNYFGIFSKYFEADELLAFVLKYDITSGENEVDEQKRSIHKKLVKAALDKGAKLENIIDSLYGISLANLDIYSELFINAVPDMFLKLVLESYVGDKELRGTQKTLVQAALDRGAKLENIIDSIYLSLETLHNCSELFLTHTTVDKFLDFILRCSIEQYNFDKKEYVINEESYTKQKELVKLALENGANIENVEIGAIPLESVLPLKELMINCGEKYFSAEAFLKVTLQAYVEVKFKAEENTTVIPEHLQKLQLDLIEFAFEQGADLKSMKLKDLIGLYLSVDTAKMLLEHGLNPHALFLYRCYNTNLYNDLTKLAVEEGVKILPLEFISVHWEDLRLETMQLLIKDLSYKIDEKITFKFMHDEYRNLGAQFKEYLDTQISNTKNLELSDKMLTYNITILHIFVLNKLKKILEYVLSNFEVNLNVLNDNNQTPLFYANTSEIAELLINHGADLSVKDIDGNMWLRNPDLELIKYLKEKNLISQFLGNDKILKNHFIKGNYEHAYKLFSYGMALKSTPLKDVVDAIETGLENSVENNKYQALLNLMHKAGIKIPSKFEHMIHTFHDNFTKDEFDFLDGFTHKLAAYYLNKSEQDLKNQLASECPMLKADLANRSFLDKELNYSIFADFKTLCTGSTLLNKIENNFDSYYQLVGKALNRLDDDYSLEVLTLNGLVPKPIEEEIAIFRGLKFNVDNEDINAWFKYGIKAFSIGENQKFLGFYVNQPWNKIDEGRWEFGGTYVSLEPNMSAGFAGGMTAKNAMNTESVFIEMRISKNSPHVCGSYTFEYELIFNSIKGEEVVAVYKLDVEELNYNKKFKVISVAKNPYISNGIKPKYQVGEYIGVDQEAINKYKSLKCHTEHTGDMKSSLYKDYDDFINKYTLDQHSEDQNILLSTYFTDRVHYGNYTVKALFGFDGFEYNICDPEYLCC
ncbi:ankyrin repeat domain-containing protein [Candidatus Jidaibacter acanthamoebae]|nr:ankyrin repeat domain-containing protein [Candidatus Jidaibacter acanthamoeba]